MNRKLQLMIILCVVAAVSSAGSHILIGWLHIQTTAVEYRSFAPEAAKPPAFVAGSSLMLYGLSWDQVARTLHHRIDNWGVPGSSPAEWEVLQSRAPGVKLTLVVISVYDLNEEFLCDFRAELVPLDQTVKDLWQNDVDWNLSKRALSQYPLSWVRTAFPTAGRSQGVMSGLRGKLVAMAKGSATAESSEAGPTMQTGGIRVAQEKISDWSQGKALRRIATMRAACEGRFSFAGPKKMALLRVLQQAQKQGRVVVLVLPVSPLFAREFLGPEVVQQFEATLAGAQRAVPQAQWIRLDRLPALVANENYWDLVHLNTFGQRIATDAVVSHFKEFSMLP
jgi:hypothetical protein